MIYLNNDGDYITSDNFIGCGNYQRDELARYYHLPDARELYNFLNGLDSWADIPADDLMERCEKALGKEA